MEGMNVQMDLGERRVLGVTALGVEHARLLADARDLTGRLARHSERVRSDSMRLALSLAQHVVELIEDDRRR